MTTPTIGTKVAATSPAGSTPATPVVPTLPPTTPPFAAFGSIPACPKCGNPVGPDPERGTVTWKPAGLQRDVPTEEECIERSCVVCQYRWAEAAIIPDPPKGRR